MRSNGSNFAQDESVTTAVRSGHGLLTGLLRCARCGRKLHIRYWGKSGTAARYLCDGAFQTGLFGQKSRDGAVDHLQHRRE